MKRADFIKTSAILLGAGMAPTALRAATDEAATLKQLVADYYSVYYTDLDARKYRSLLAADYLLLEDGEMMDADKDISLIPTAADQYRRKDSFDFRSLKVHGDAAYLVYFLSSEIQDKAHGLQKKTWLESMIMVRHGQGDSWRVAILHSTKLPKA